ncbi:hypothetical protein Trco_003376 [Trichoderma cornu-damae]|uniref:MFS general substrate transporter n=1 Tax=Trichoderma cornu-damae TaxID=654480 RepID=A0A9P8QQT2_9HYPO|nr:hypothetical protein Trco_003376 [Trichoderma cornu-damae]
MAAANDEVVVAETQLQQQRLSTWRCNSPFVQTIIVGFVLFCNPGTYLAITGLGAGGKQPQLIGIVNKANVILYCLFGGSGILGGSIINKIGPRWALMVGATGYPIYAGSLWWIDRGQGSWFVLFGGAWLGLSAGLLWSTQGSYVTTCYPTEAEKGKYIATSWVLNAMGSVVGAAIVLGVTVDNTSVSGVPSSVYITFISLESFGLLVAGLLLDPSKLRRNDGRPIASFRPLPWHQELKALGLTALEPKMALITLSIYSSEMYLSLTGAFNAWYFNARTRSLANFCYWIFQVLGALAIAWVCDARMFGSRRRRAFAAGAFVAFVIGGTWIAMVSFLVVNDIDRDEAPRAIDWTETTKFAGPFVTYMLFGACYPIFQNFHHWTYSTFSNEPHVLGRYSGYFKGFQAFGTATAFGIDTHGVQFIREAGAYFGIMAAGLALTMVSVYFYTTNTRYGQEEGVVIPEAFEDVVAEHEHEHELVDDKAVGQN